MKTNNGRIFIVQALLCAVLLALCCCAMQQPVAEPSSIAGVEKKDNGRFLAKHAAFLEREAEGPIDVLFLGDSITENWSSRGAQVWQTYYGHLVAANFGIGGDRIEHVIWRLEHGELDRARPRVVVLMIGTNNSASNTGQQIAEGVQAVIRLIRQKSADSKVLLLGILPRGPRIGADKRFEDSARRMEMIRSANVLLAKLDDGKRVRFLDIGNRFLVDGLIPTAWMPDQLHPSSEGYQIWAQAMQPLLQSMLAGD